MRPLSKLPRRGGVQLLTWFPGRAFSSATLAPTSAPAAWLCSITREADLNVQPACLLAERPSSSSSRPPPSWPARSHSSAWTPPPPPSPPSPTHSWVGLIKYNIIRYTILFHNCLMVALVRSWLRLHSMLHILRLYDNFDQPVCLKWTYTFTAMIPSQVDSSDNLTKYKYKYFWCMKLNSQNVNNFWKDLLIS